MKSNKKSYGLKKLEKLHVDEVWRREADTFLNRLAKEAPHFKEINAVILFGSMARGDYSVRHSDVDVMFLLDLVVKSAIIEEKIRKKVIGLSVGAGIDVQVVFQYRKVEGEDRSLMLTIAREGKVLFARKSIVISQNILGLREYYLLKFDVAEVNQVVKNKVQRFLYGYSLEGRKYKGIVDEEKVFSAGRGAILVAGELLAKVLLYGRELGVTIEQKGKFYR